MTRTPLDEEEEVGTAIVVRHGAGDAITRMEAAEKAGTFNVLWPISRIDPARQAEVAEFYIASVSQVTISRDPKRGEVYHDFRFAKEREGLAALTARGLNKLASAAGIEWDLDRTGQVSRERLEGGHVAIHYRAVGRVRQATGGWREEIGEKYIDTSVIEARRIVEVQNKAERDKARVPSDEEARKAIRLEILAIIEHSLARAETMAKNRVLRRLFNVPQVFTFAELDRVFMVPLVLFKPALEAGELGRRAAADLYGHERQLPAGSPAPSAGLVETTPPDVSSPVTEGSAEGVGSANGPPLETRYDPDEPGPDYIPGVDGPAVEDVGAGMVPGESPGQADSPSLTASETPAPTPAEDPMVNDGPFKNYRFSALSKTDKGREWLRTEEAAKGPIYRRKLADAWLEHAELEEARAK